MEIKRKLTTYRILGGIFILLGILGYFTVGDELRHLGEFLSVTCVLVSGIIFMMIDFRLQIFRKIALQWVSICLLVCIPFGGIILDNLPVGIGIGLLVGIALAILLGRTKASSSHHSGFEK